MNLQQRFMPVFCLVVILAVFAYAQQPAPPKAPKITEPAEQKPAAAPAKPATNVPKDAVAEMTPQQMRALSLTHEAGQEAFTIETKRDSALLQARAADVLWPHDREGARKFFDQAFEMATTYYRESKDTNSQRVGNRNQVNRSDIRLEIIKLVNRYDKALGESYLTRFTDDKRREAEEKRKQSPPTNFDKLFGENADQANDLTRIASELLPVDPATAQRLALHSLNQGVSTGMAEFLAQLSVKDRAAADKLYVAALAALQRAPQPMPGQILALAAYPFGEGLIRVVSGPNNMGWGFGKPKDFTINPAQAQQFLQAAYTTLVRATPPTIQQHPQANEIIGAAYFTTQTLAPKVAQYHPALLEEWNDLAGRLQALTADQNRQAIERHLKDEAERQNNAATAQANRVKDSLEEAEKTQDPTERDARFVEAALQSDEAAQGLEIASRIVDLDLRRRTKSWLSYRASQQARDKKQWDDALRYAMDVTETDQRAYLIFVLAQSLLKDGNRPRAIELLQTAQREAESAENNVGKVRALIGIANTFVAFEPARGFEVIELAIKAANQIKEKANFDNDEAKVVRSFEFKFGGLTNVNTAPDFDLGKTLVGLSRLDYERALTLVQQLEHKPAKIGAMLSLTESLLKKNDAAK
jgi:hypothetical protein